MLAWTLPNVRVIDEVNNEENELLKNTKQKPALTKVGTGIFLLRRLSR